jgi:hypothetical protein
MAWTLCAVLVLAAGYRFRRRLRDFVRPRGAPVIDDEAIRHIIGTGRLPGRGGEPRTDLEEARRAEEEFWAESWDEPEEYRS